MKRKINTLLAALLLLFTVEASAEVTVTKSHTLSLLDSSKYAEDFTHFEYANPNAPIGGTFTRAMYGTFDSFNTFAPKGVVFRGMGYIYDTLMTSSYDEALTYYGLIAESVEYPSDYTWVIFHLNKNAKWHDGKPITAEDVVYSFNKITEVNPILKDYYKLVKKAEIINKHTVKFSFDTENVSKELPFLMGQLTIIPKHYWETRDLSKSTLEIPLGNGPYKIKSFDAGKRVVIERVPDYWAKDLPVNVGQNVINNIVFEYFRDTTVAFEAFKAGHFDFIADGPGARWQKGYTGKYFDMGLIVKQEIMDEGIEGIGGFVFNTSKTPFDDIDVRKALTFAYDYEWINKNINFNMEKRYDSYFSSSEFAMNKSPEPEIVEIIKSVNPNASKELLEGEFVFPKTDGTGNNRANLMKSVELFKQAGYNIKDGKMTDKNGTPLSFEILTSSKTIESELLNFQEALKRIGVEMNIRFVDSSQYVKRVRDREYMMIYTMFRQSESPGNEQRGMWHSTAAADKGSRNYAMINDPAVDKVVEKLIVAKDRKELIKYTKVLDRLLLNGWYIIPSGYADRYRIAYWDKFGMPEVMPTRGIAISTWWIVPEKAEKIAKELNK